MGYLKLGEVRNVLESGALVLRLLKAALISEMGKCPPRKKSLPIKSETCCPLQPLLSPLRIVASALRLGTHGGEEFQSHSEMAGARTCPYCL